MHLPKWLTFLPDHLWSFGVFLWNHLSSLGDWIDGKAATEAGGTVAGHATTVGAITFAVIGALAAMIFVCRRWGGEGQRTKKHSIVAKTIGFFVVLGAIPVVAGILICLSKYLTFASAIATTIGVLVALDNNKRIQAKDDRRLEQQESAARAALTPEISQILDYCKSAAVALMTPKVVLLQSGVFSWVLFREVTLPDMPGQVSQKLADMMTNTRDMNVSGACSLTIVHAQLVAANLGELHSKSLIIYEETINRKLLRVAVLHSISESMLPYSRHMSDAIPKVGWDDIKASAERINATSRASFNEYVERIEELHPHDPTNLLVAQSIGLATPKAKTTPAPTVAAATVTPATPPAPVEPTAPQAALPSKAKTATKPKSEAKPASPKAAVSPAKPKAAPLSETATPVKPKGRSPKSTTASVRKPRTPRTPES